MKSCVFAGTFDPITIGHEHVIKKCIKKYSKVFVVIGTNPNKNPLFTLDERLKIVQDTFANYKNVFVVLYEDKKDNYREFLQKEGVKYYVRGIRTKEDLCFENDMKKKNKVLYPFVKTKYVKTPKEFREVSSTLVKDLIKNGKDFLEFLPTNSKKTITEILANKTTKNA